MKKYAPYILILIIVLVGLFSPVAKAEADCVNGVEGAGLDTGKCIDGSGNVIPGEVPIVPLEDNSLTPLNTVGVGTTEPKKEQSEFAKWATDESCGIIGTSSVAGCIKAVFYYVVYTPSAVLLSIAATFFNALISISLSSALFTNSSFIPPAWAVVRDLSNIFFILILLYIAVKIILGLGGTDVKKMIAKVVIIALLINFSMFFTQVIIDSSNILALIFYNKLDVTYKDSNGQTAVRPYGGATGAGEKDISGSMYNGFDITSKLNSTFWEQTKAMAPDSGGQPAKSQAQVPVGTMVGIILVASAIMLFAAYAFFVSGIFFIARMIELFVLIIFSPFAFISYAVPGLAKYEYIGWDAWSKRLIEVAFMAPIFMFFMYLIFSLLNAKLFGGLITVQKDWIQTILGVIIPGMMILILLLQAVKFAKKGSGAMGEMVMKGAKMAGGLALGATVGTAAFAGRRAIGGGGGYLANKGAKFAEEHGFERTANKLRDAGDFARKSSFDIRGAKIGGQTLASATGMKVGEASKGGWNEIKKQQVEKRQKRADELEKRGTGAQKKAVDMAEIQLKETTLPVKLDLEQVDKQIEKAKVDLTNARNGGDEEGVKNARETLKTEQARKTAIRENNIDKDGKPMKSIVDLEKEVREAKQELAVKSDKITTEYAKKISGGTSKTLNFVFRGGYSLAGADEAARKIRTGTKLDSGEKPK